MADHERPLDVDQPEPEDALSAEGERNPDHPPGDQDDREVLLDDPAATTPPVDEGERAPDPDAPQPGDGT